MLEYDPRGRDRQKGGKGRGKWWGEGGGGGGTSRESLLEVSVGGYSDKLYSTRMTILGTS